MKRFVALVLVVIGCGSVTAPNDPYCLTQADTIGVIITWNPDTRFAVRCDWLRSDLAKCFSTRVARLHADACIVGVTRGTF